MAADWSRKIPKQDPDGVSSERGDFRGIETKEPQNKNKLSGILLIVVIVIIILIVYFLK